jgi:threonine dehydrogenase-like Zn-dependent dehydrogenase
MLAAVFEGNGKLVIKERPKPGIKNESDVLIKVTASGICGTDLHILQVPPAHPATEGCILGHEFTGEIVEVGNKALDLQVGDMVVVNPHPPCGLCRYCKMGRPDRCKNMYTPKYPGNLNTMGIFSDGGMANYVVVPEHSLYKINSEILPRLASLAEPLACVVNATDKVKVQPGDTAVILGAGPIGLLFVLMFKASGVAKLIVSEPLSIRRKAAIECGATLTVDPQNEDLELIVKEETDGGADVVVEAVGPFINQALCLVRSSGKIIQFGHDELARPEIHVGDIVRHEISIFGAFGTYIGQYTFDRVVKIIESGVLPLEKVISHCLSLSRINEGIELLRKGKAIKVIIHPDE